MTNAQSKMAQVDDQYEQLCPNCDCVLHEGVGIYCLEHEDGDEAVLCSDCWDSWKEDWIAEGWKCDEYEFFFEPAGSDSDSDSDSDDESVDDRDAPNVYPYKKCCDCGERKSCGNYNPRHEWLCEDCSEDKDFEQMPIEQYHATYKAKHSFVEPAK